MQEKETFPLYIDRFPIQLLSFLRFSRIQDTAQFASASFEKDIIVGQMNEYETLQLVMGELRDRFQSYIDGQVWLIRKLTTSELVWGVALPPL
jgi:protein-histidine N-methyltransferase